MDTKTDVGRSKVHIEALLEKFGVSETVIKQDHVSGDATVCFVHQGRPVAIPVRVDDYFKAMVRNGARRTDANFKKARRAVWRVLHDRLKSQLIQIECGQQTFEEAFLADFGRLNTNGGVVRLGDAVAPLLSGDTREIERLLQISGPSGES